jgi:hypothetical protein
MLVARIPARTLTLRCKGLRVREAKQAVGHGGTSPSVPRAHRLCGETLRVARIADIILAERDGIPSVACDFPQGVTGGTTGFAPGP